MSGTPSSSRSGSLTPPVTLTGTNPATTPLTVAGAAAQAVDVFTVEDSAGADLLRVGETGYVIVQPNATGQAAGATALSVSGTTVLAGNAANDDITLTVSPGAGQTERTLQVLNATGQDVITVTGAKLGCFNVTPVIQQTGGAKTADLVYGQTEVDMLNALWGAMQAYGLLT